MAHIGGAVDAGGCIITSGDVSCGVVDKLDATGVVVDVRGRWDDPVPLLTAADEPAATIAGSRTYPAMYRARAAACCAMDSFSRAMDLAAASALAVAAAFRRSALLADSNALLRAASSSVISFFGFLGRFGATGAVPAAVVGSGGRSRRR
jgi:hypothetical protein